MGLLSRVADLINVISNMVVATKMGFRTIRDLDQRDLEVRVLVRLDLNTPLDDSGQITDDSRIRSFRRFNF